ncbi:MotA/TolQ/ExbB proton channel family protein [Alteriqipengyuania lutimaris]|uniref:MotA/TolQ/ExbB proton channel family protein n=1 Tax=Alteriqipengyuania lutimaris TaxID=1538146 RepID=UPI0017F873A0|nr:MotA/TolQ/ExbB proton channel family protein [Alteriqipengyuania lutimaris]MBB3033975.1 chemotaxis protein MotA [Alteriqipengyuania lutimaris]
MENFLTLIDRWFDPVSLAIVLGGTVLATLLRCGPAQVRLGLGRIARLGRRPFDPARAKAQFSRQLRDIADHGPLRAEPVRTDDPDLAKLSQVLSGPRPREELAAAHARDTRGRTEAARAAIEVFHQAAELAPVLGLAGTLIALGTMPADGGEVGMAGAIAMAVVTTLYGLATANFLFGPLAAAIERRSAREEEDRQAIVDWLEQSIRGDGVPLRGAVEHGAEIAHFPAELRKAS